MINSHIILDTQHAKDIHQPELDYYGKTLATASSDHSIRLWDVSGNNPAFLAELHGHEGPVWDLSWSHPKFGNLLASCGYDRRIILWRQNTPQQWSIILRNEDHTSSVNSVCFSPCEFGLHLAAASSDGTVSVMSYNIESSTWTRKAWQAHSIGALSVNWSPALSDSTLGNLQSVSSRRRLVTGGCDFQIQVWVFIENTEEWILSQSLNTDKLCKDWIYSVAWRPHVDGQNCIASSCGDGTVVIWVEGDNQSWKSKQTLKFGTPVWKVSWSITGTILAVAYDSNKVELYRENSMGTWEKIQSTFKDELTRQADHNQGAHDMHTIQANS